MGSQKINSLMFKLLIEKGLDDFSVMEARDVLMSVTKEFDDAVAARKFVYRQILRFEQKNWLTAIGEGRKKKYRKTDFFKKNITNLQPATISDAQVDRDLPKSPVTELLKEKRAHEGGLAIVLGEVEEYQSLLQRFPKHQKVLQELLEDARERSAKLLGRINALVAVLKLSGSQEEIC